MPEIHNLEDVIWPQPISLRYDLNLYDRSRQLRANQIGPEGHDAPDWSATNTETAREIWLRTQYRHFFPSKKH